MTLTGADHDVHKSSSQGKAGNELQMPWRMLSVRIRTMSIAAPDYLDPYGADHHDRWLLCLCDPQLFPSYWSGSWLSDRRRGRIEASERGRDEGASGELLHKR